MNPTITLSCILALLPMFSVFYKYQPYAASQFAYGFVKFYFITSGAVLSACSLLIVYVAINVNAPFKTYLFALVLLAFGFYIASNSFKK